MLKEIEKFLRDTRPEEMDSGIMLEWADAIHDLLVKDREE